MESGGLQTDTRLDELSRRLRDVEGRLAALEAQSGMAAPSRAPETEPPESFKEAVAAWTRPADAETAASVESAAAPSSWTDAVPLTGRTLVVLAGAFALRALTEGGVLPQLVGTLLALVYAALWLVLADRAAGRHPTSHSATFHGVAGAVIGFPLIWEATAQFRFLPPTAGATALALFTALGLAVAFRHGHRTLAVMITAGGAVTALVLTAGTGRPVLFAAVLLVLGLATLWLSYLRRWRALAWAVAIVLDGVMLLLPLIVLRGAAERVEEMFSPLSLLLLQLALVVGYLGSFAVRAAPRRRDLHVGEILQGIAALALGLGGAMAVTEATAITALPLGLGAAVIAAICYGASFAFMDRHSEQRVSFILYTTVALLCALLVVHELLWSTQRVLVLCLLAVAGAWLGTRYERATLSGHGALYALAAAFYSGLLIFCLEALLGSTAPALSMLSPAAWGVLAVAAVYCAFPVHHGHTWGRLSPLPKLGVAALLALGLAAAAVAWATPWLAAGDGQRAALAVLRTAVLALLALLLAAAGRRPRLAEIAGLVYPWLALGGVKLMAEDLRVGGPGSLLLSFALYGGALILAPRLSRRK